MNINVYNGQLTLPFQMVETRIYNLRIVPPNPVFKEVYEFKRQFETICGKQPLSKSLPHITLASFAIGMHSQAKLIEAFNQLSNIKRFELDIEGFHMFENSFTLHLKVANTKILESIRTEIRIVWARDLHGKPAKLTGLGTPHITISKTTERTLLYQSLAFFQKIDYFRRIEVDYLTLVSRDINGSWDWEHKIKLS